MAYEVEVVTNWPQLQEAISTYRWDSSDPSAVLVTCKHLIENEGADSVEKTLTNPANKDVVDAIGWELIGVLVSVLAKSLPSDETKSHCESLLHFIVEQCNAKEVILALLEALGRGDFVLKFKILLRPLWRALVHLKPKRSRFLKMICECVMRSVKQMNIPHGGRLGEILDRNVADKCQGIRDLEQMKATLENVLELLNPLATELRSFFEDRERASTGTNSPEIHDEMVALQNILSKFLIDLCAYPLTSLEVGAKDTTERASNESTITCVQPSESCRDLAEKILYILYKSCTSFAMLFELGKNENYFEDKHLGDSDDEDVIEEEKKYNLLGLSSFAYLILGERIGLEFFPAVFTSQYLFLSSTKYCQALLERPEVLILKKGVCLLSMCLRNVDDDVLSVTRLESHEFLTIAMSLTYVMVHCQLQDLRKTSLQVLLQLISKFQREGRYKILEHVLNKSSHAGVQGVAIDLVRGEIICQLNTQDAQARCLYTCKLQGNLLNSIFFVPFLSSDIDVIEKCDRIMATLNLLRFLLLRDKEDCTCIWKRAKQIETNFLDPLRQVLLRAEMQLKSELLAIKTEMKEGRKCNTEDELEFRATSLDGVQLEDLPPTEKLTALEGGHKALDLMHSVLARVCEVIDQGNE